MTITKKDVKFLREKTLAGFLDCKKSLIDANGVMELAEKILYQKGLISAEKRVGRRTSDGSVFITLNNNNVAMVELTCETQFVAMNKVFRSAGNKIVEIVASSKSIQKTDELNLVIKGVIAVLKENIILGKILYWDIDEDELVVKYIHNDRQIGVLVKLRCGSKIALDMDETKNLANDLALHITAFNPPFLNTSEVDTQYKKEQEQIYYTQAEKLENKSEKVIHEIVQEKLDKHLSTICLLEQKFIKDDNKSVRQVIQETAENIGFSVELVDYAYINIGCRV